MGWPARKRPCKDMEMVVAEMVSEGPGEGVGCQPLEVAAAQARQPQLVTPECKRPRRGDKAGCKTCGWSETWGCRVS